MRSHLTHLDRAITRMLDERARLAQQIERDGAAPGATAPFVDDLLRRAEGDFPADALRSVFQAIEDGCARSAEAAQ